MGSSAAGDGRRDTEYVRSVQAARCSGEVEPELDAA